MGGAMKAITSAILLSIVSLSAHGQGAASASSAASGPLGPGEVAFVGDDRIPESIFRLFTLASLQTDAENLTPEARTQVIDRLVIIELLAQEAEKRGLPNERRVAAELELQRLQTLARNMTNRYTEENPPTEAELRDLYQASLPQLQQTQYKTRHILVESEDEARDVLDELDDGEDFADLAQEYSIDQTAAQGGDLGWLTVSSVPAFANVLPTATPGVPLSDPVQSNYGWHVILVDEIKEEPAPSFEDVRDDLTAAVEAQKLTKYVESLRENSQVRLTD
jgi:peptidyl-prolyl cis-trans isomerase C